MNKEINRSMIVNNYKFERYKQNTLKMYKFKLGGDNRVSINHSQRSEQLTMLNTLERCTQILRQDRIWLRAQLKSFDEEVIDIFKKHPKQTQLQQLQIKLRKYVNGVKTMQKIEQLNKFKENLNMGDSYKDKEQTHVKQQTGSIDILRDKSLNRVKSQKNNSFQSNIQSFQHILNKHKYGNQASNINAMVNRSQAFDKYNFKNEGYRYNERNNQGHKYNQRVSESCKYQQRKYNFNKTECKEYEGRSLNKNISSMMSSSIQHGLKAYDVIQERQSENVTSARQRRHQPQFNGSQKNIPYPNIQSNVIGQFNATGQWNFSQPKFNQTFKPVSSLYQLQDSNNHTPSQNSKVNAFEEKSIFHRHFNQPTDTMKFKENKQNGTDSLHMQSIISQNIYDESHKQSQWGYESWRKLEQNEVLRNANCKQSSHEKSVEYKNAARESNYETNQHLSSLEKLKNSVTKNKDTSVLFKPYQIDDQNIFTPPQLLDQCRRFLKDRNSSIKKEKYKAEIPLPTSFPLSQQPYQYPQMDQCIYTRSMHHEESSQQKQYRQQTNNQIKDNVVYNNTYDEQKRQHNYQHKMKQYAENNHKQFNHFNQLPLKSNQIINYRQNNEQSFNAPFVNNFYTTNNLSLHNDSIKPSKQKPQSSYVDYSSDFHFNLYTQPNGPAQFSSFSKPTENLKAISCQLQNKVHDKSILPTPKSSSLSSELQIEAFIDQLLQLNNMNVIISTSLLLKHCPSLAHEGQLMGLMGRKQISLLEVALGLERGEYEYSNESVKDVCSLIDVEQKGYITEGDVQSFLDQINEAVIENYDEIAELLWKVYQQANFKQQDKITYWNIFLIKHTQQFICLCQLLGEFEFEIQG